MRIQREALRVLTAQALTAMKAGNRIVAKSVGDIHDIVDDRGMKAAVEKGTKLRELWERRIDDALGEVGGPNGAMVNPVIEAMQEVGQKIQKQAPDDASRDLGICADGQLALHYWTAAFGTVKAYAAQLGIDRVVADMQSCLDEAKEADREHSAIAAHIMAG